MNDAGFDAILDVSRLSDITNYQISQIEISIRAVNFREGLVSLSSIGNELQDLITRDRLESIFFALVQFGVLVRIKKSRRGFYFDCYQLNENLLSSFCEKVFLAKYIRDEVKKEGQSKGVEIVATLPSTLPIHPDTRKLLPSLSVSIHRLITESKNDIIILNPFFEQTGFDRLASALLAAAERDVDITIITRGLNDQSSINYKVLENLLSQASGRGLSTRFKIYQYQLIQEGRIVLTSHAKILLVDKSKLYLGSANLTEYGMTRFVEAGVILQGQEVVLLVEILTAILQSPEVEYIHIV